MRQECGAGHFLCQTREFQNELLRRGGRFLGFGLGYIREDFVGFWVKKCGF
jgi:hypothetical protein